MRIKCLNICQFLFIFLILNLKKKFRVPGRKHIYNNMYEFKALEVINSCFMKPPNYYDYSHLCQNFTILF